jgi:hypothetical protein
MQVVRITLLTHNFLYCPDKTVSATQQFLFQVSTATFAKQSEFRQRNSFTVLASSLYSLLSQNSSWQKWDSCGGSIYLWQRRQKVYRKIAAGRRKSEE